MNNRSNKVKHLVLAAFIGSAYAALTIMLAPISYGQIQVRISEALTLLPYFSKFSIPGLFIGCIIANLVGGYGLPDIVFGSLATLTAAILTYLIGKSNIKYKKYLAPLPPVVINAVVIGLILKYTLNLPLLITIFWVGLGEAVSCYLFGLFLVSVVEKNARLKKYFIE
ncbi:MAG: putative rane protein [Firmicutes bacterium]|nr:putative rane protein [Bacillota bacterium]